jgi:enoyl-CoA hydratase
MDLLSTADLRALMLEPAAPASPLLPRSLLFVDSAAAQGFDDARVLDWLRRIPAPVIAVGGDACPLSRACDVHVSDIEAAERLRRTIAEHPLAASTLVQTLRLTQKLDAENGLVAESLAYASLQNGAEFRRWQRNHEATPAPDESGAAVELERECEGLSLTLNRPLNRNAMTVEMRDALIEALTLALVDDGIRSLDIRAKGRCFSTGGDLREFGRAPDPSTAHAVRGLALPGRLLAMLAERTTVYLHGACIGSGIEFPAFAGRLVATRDAWFQLPELRYGLIPGAGGTVSIAKRIGRQRTAWLALSGQRIDARTAKLWGLVDAIED